MRTALTAVVVLVLLPPVLLARQGSKPRSQQGAAIAAKPPVQPAATLGPKLKAEIARVDSDIADTEAENAKYAGGLVKALAEARLGILRQTRAMLSQRATAVDFNVAIHYTADGRPFTLPEGSAAALAGVEAELEGMKAKIAAAEAEADKYSGGLVQAMSLSTVATMRQTQAMLEQRRVSLKYGLPQYVGFAELNKSSSPSSALTGKSPTVAPVVTWATAPASDKDWEIVSVDSRVTESNSTWWKYAWKLTLRNKGATAHAFRATIEFQDKDGFIIDTDTSDMIVVQPNAEETATGYALIRVPGASSVARTLAKVGIVR